MVLQRSEEVNGGILPTAGRPKANSGLVEFRVVVRTLEFVRVEREPFAEGDMPFEDNSSILEARV